MDAIADLFIGRVAKFRGVSVEQVSSDFGKGGVKSARQAIAAGMADGLGDYEGLTRADDAVSEARGDVSDGGGT